MSNDKWLEAVGVRTLGLIHKEHNEYEQALHLLLQSADTFMEIQEGHFLAVTYGSLASLSRDFGKYHDANIYLEKAISTADHLENNTEILSVFKQKKTKLLIKLREFDEADSCNEDAFKLTQIIKRHVGEAYYEHSKALIQEGRGDLDGALKHIEKSANLFCDFGAKEDFMGDLERIRKKALP